MKYEAEKREMRITVLEKENEYYTWLGITIAAVLLLAFATLLFRHRSNVQKRKLAEQQVKRLEQEQQLVVNSSMLALTCMTTA